MARPPGPKRTNISRATYDPHTLPVGVFGRPHGLRGEIFLRPFNAHGADLGQVDELVIEPGGVQRRRFAVRGARRAPEGWLMSLEGVEPREAAAALTHALVRAPRAALPPLAPGEFFVEDVIGCEVVGQDGRALGVAGSVFWNGAHDVMVVTGDLERLVPLVPTVVRAVDAQARRVVIEWSDDEEIDEGESGQDREGQDGEDQDDDSQDAGGEDVDSENVAGGGEPTTDGKRDV